MTDFNKEYDSERNHQKNNDFELDVPDFLKKDKIIMNKEEYSSMIKNSTSGAPAKAKPSKMKKVNKKHMKKALVTMCCTCMIFGAIAAQGVKSLIKGVQDVFEIENAVIGFHQEAVTENTYRVNSGKDYAYHYDKIAEHVKTDEDVYLLYRDLGEYQSNLVLEHVDGIENIESFVKDHNYESKEDWVKVSNQQILLQNDIASKQQELNKMSEEYKNNNQISETNMELGGK